MIQKVHFGGNFMRIAVQARTSEDSVYDVQDFQTLVDAAELVRRQTKADVVITGKKSISIRKEFPAASKKVVNETEPMTFKVNVKIGANPANFDNDKKAAKEATDQADTLFVSRMNQEGNDISSFHYKANGANSSSKFMPGNLRQVDGF